MTHGMGLLPDTQNCVLCMRWECRERFPRHRRLAIPTCITARAWRTCRDACRDWKKWSRWRGKHSRQSRRMRNLHFYVSCKRPMGNHQRGCWVNRSFWAINSLWPSGTRWCRSGWNLVYSYSVLPKDAESLPEPILIIIKVFCNFSPRAFSL